MGGGMMRGNCVNRSSSICVKRSSSNCVRRTSSAASNFKASRKKVAPPKKRDVNSTLMQNIHRVETLILSEKLKDTETPAYLKSEIKREIVTRVHDEDADAAAAAVAVIVEQTPQRAPQPARASLWLIEKLYDKRGPERAKALAGVIELLNRELDHDDLKKHYVVEVLYRCLSGVKKGSTKEVQYSLKVIGLLSIIVDCQEKVSEIYRELLDVASTSACLKKAGTNTTKMLECLGVVGFFGAVNAEETQAAMKVIWDFMINLKSESGSGDANNQKKILLAAINSWLFLLTSMEGWRLNQTCWRGAISFFMDLFDDQYDTLVHKAAAAALALIFEINSLDKFWNGATVPYSELQKTLREMILDKLSGLNMSVDVVKHFESPRAYPTVCEEKMVLTSWYQVIQLEFLRSFLGNEFENYMKKEEKLQSFFEFRPYRNANVDEELYEPTIEKIKLNIFKPRAKDQQTMTAEQKKKERAWRSSIQDKEKTLVRAYQRKMSAELNCFD